MNLEPRGWSVALAVVALTSAAHAVESDPCDFASSTDAAFAYERVMQCYRSVPFERADLVNILGVIGQHRSFSDLAELYDARVHWREALAALDRDYPNDAAMHEAIVREHHEFRNVHVSYLPPRCYTALAVALTPFEFGSTVIDSIALDDGAGPEQIVFIEGTLLADTYREATGIDATALVGQRVVSINGVPVLDYFRAYAEDLKVHQDASGGLNGVLSYDAYSVRLNGGGDYLPERSADEYVLESRDGQLTSLTLPWVFVRRSTLQPGAALPLTQSTEEFVRLCQVGPELAQPAAAVAQRPLGALGPFAVDDEREDLVRRLRALGSRGGRANAAGNGLPASAASMQLELALPELYYEVPPEQLGQGIETIIPRTNNAAVFQYDGHVTALRLFDTNAWVDVAREGIAHACENSDRLIVDLRGNTGGNDTTIRWLHHHLLPAEGQLVPAGMLPLRLRNDNPVFNEMLFNSARFMAEFAPGLGIGPCEHMFTPGCLTDIDTGEPLVAAADWFIAPSVVERRGGVGVSLTRHFAFQNVGDPEFDVASCAGRFQAEDLVFITDGRNASGGYFLPAAFKGEGVIVSMGGYLGEPMAMGRALSGGSIPSSTWAGVPEAIEAATEGAIQFENEFSVLQRPVTVRMEMLGVYQQDGRTLHIRAPIEADLHVDVWTDLPGSDGFVYERVLEAVDEAAACADE
jgi:hypothetical protein